MCQLKIFFQSELIFTIVISNQFKTGVKSTLTSQIKELGAINTFVIKNWLKPGLIQINDNEKHEMASLAMRMNLGLSTSVVGSVQQRKMVLTRTRTMRKKPF